MSPIAEADESGLATELIRVRGIVQGVGFRPAVWRIARDLGLHGEVRNDGDGVLIRARGPLRSLDGLVERLSATPPPLARIDVITREPQPYGPPVAREFSIATSSSDAARTGVAPDAALCPACLRDTLDPRNRRFRYPFTNCTHCGPRFSIVRAIPWDRPNTAMSKFGMCPECRDEYERPADRRFHAQPNACPACGPRAWLERLDGAGVEPGQPGRVDGVDAAGALLRRGEILAVKGIGGFHIACDATRRDAVRRLRERKRRDAKPFAVMARDLEIVRECCEVSDVEARLLSSPAAPIVILRVHDAGRLAPDVAPGQNTLGFMLPYTPLHHLLLQGMDHPVVMTSGNLSEEPQCTQNGPARERLSGIAGFALMHDRDIVNRVDDSVVRVLSGTARVLRRARGYAPAPLPLPDGFEEAPDLLAMGPQLKNSFCLIKDGRAILSQHMGDLEDARTYADYNRNLALYERLYRHVPDRIAIDLHPGYLSTRRGRELADERNLPVEEVQHHHAHIAACMAENGVALDESPVLGVALDGLGMGGDGTLWGGEFLRADYRGFERLGTFLPVAMPGGTRAILEPWRNTWAHLSAAFGWPRYRQEFPDLELTGFLESKPIATLERMCETGFHSPAASSCGRLFDAVAAALGICRERVSYEGQAAIELEATMDPIRSEGTGDDRAYPFAIANTAGSGLPRIEHTPMWRALLGDLGSGTPVPVIAARFHTGLASAVAGMVDLVSAHMGDSACDTVALSGGVFQNRTLLEQVERRLLAAGFRVLTHHHVPFGDGGVALGQAAVAAARSIPDKGRIRGYPDTEAASRGGIAYPSGQTGAPNWRNA